METKGTETVDLTPTREGYIVMLRTIIEGSTNKDDVVWAEREIVKLGGSMPKMVNWEIAKDET